jgi:2-polyprenyl-3-methyl-5-hydroxy-6-metoxy-1,4-benzoquinol methylase
VDEEIRAYYETGEELGRLERGYWRLEFTRTKELLLRYLPPPPARILDVGGGPGVYAEWLADVGYDVKLVDVTPLHVREAQRRAAGRFVSAEGDARALADADGSYDVVLLLGPLYHLVERDDRVRALTEARRVLRPQGLLATAAISRFGSLLDGFLRGRLDETGWKVVERALADGRHLPGPDRTLFTTAFFHLPDELQAEIEETRFELLGLFGIEGPGWLRPETLDDEEGLETAARVARAVELERTIIGASAHLLAIARRP